MIEAAELTIYLQNGNQTTIELSPMQLKTIAVALGLSFQGDTSYRCISDQALPAVIEHLQKVIKVVPKK